MKPDGEVLQGESPVPAAARGVDTVGEAASFGKSAGGFKADNAKRLEKVDQKPQASRSAGTRGKGAQDEEENEVKVYLDPTDEWEDLDQGHVVRAKEISILANAEPGDPEAKLTLRMDLPDGSVAVMEHDIATFVQAVRGVAAKYGV